MAFSAKLLLNSRTGFSKKRINRCQSVKALLHALARALSGSASPRATWIAVLICSSSGLAFPGVKGDDRSGLSCPFEPFSPELCVDQIFQVLGFPGSFAENFEGTLSLLRLFGCQFFQVLLNLLVRVFFDPLADGEDGQLDGQLLVYQALARAP